MIIQSQFKPPTWLANCHAQTIWQSYFRKQAKIPLTRERFELADGDFLDIDKTRDVGGTIVVILHGLEGRLDSKYAGMLEHLARHNYTAILMYHRSCSGEMNRFAKSYHSGYTDDIYFLMQQLKNRFPQRKVCFVGYSLGGSIVINYLAKVEKNYLPDFSYIISVPFELQKGADKLNQGFSKVYRSYLLRRMKKKLIEKQHYPDIASLNLSRLLQCQDFNVFDHEYTASVNGFANNQDYYQKCSARQYLKDIQSDTHILHAADDPFMTPDCIPKDDEISNSVTLELAKKGGHVGFIYGEHPFAMKYWAEEQLIKQLNSRNL